MNFGAVGPYERLHGTVFGELDPAHPLNVGIVNLDLAARNTHGKVEYQSDFRVLKPLDLDRGNGCLLYDVPNRTAHVVLPTEPAISGSLAISRGCRKRVPSFPRSATTTGAIRSSW